MTEKTILYTVIGIAIAVVLAILTKAMSKSITPDASGQYNLRMNNLYGFLGYFGLAIGLLFLVGLPLAVDKIDGRVIIGILLMLLIFWGAGIPCLLYYRNHKTSFDNKTILVTDVYGKVKQVEWTQIIDIKFNAFSGLLILKTNNERVKVHQHLVGLSKFIEQIEQNTKWTRKELRVPIGK